MVRWVAGKYYACGRYTVFVPRLGFLSCEKGFSLKIQNVEVFIYLLFPARLDGTHVRC